MMTARELCGHAWTIARERFPYLDMEHFQCPWQIDETKLPPKGAKAIVDELAYRAAAFWLDKLSANGEFDKGAQGAITAGRLRRRLLQHARVAVPRAVIIAVAVSKGFDIFADEYDVWIWIEAPSDDDYCPV